VNIGDFVDAYDYFKKCLVQDPSNSAVLNNLALTELKLGGKKLPDAIGHWKTALPLSTQSELGQNIARLVLQIGKGRILGQPAQLKDAKTDATNLYTTFVLNRKVAVTPKTGWLYMLPLRLNSTDGKGPEFVVEAKDQSVVLLAGAGIVVHPGYVLLSGKLAHSLKDFMIADSEGRERPATLVGTSDDGGWNLFHSADLKAPPAPIDFAATANKTEYVIPTFPKLRDPNNPAFQAAALLTPAADSSGNQYLFSNVATTTVLGTPVVNSGGNVIAVHTGCYRFGNKLYGAAVPLADAMPLLDGQIPWFKSAMRSGDSLPPAEINQQIGSSMVLVLATQAYVDLGLARAGLGNLEDKSCDFCKGRGVCGSCRKGLEPDLAPALPATTPATVPPNLVPPANPAMPVR
jgi:hypothetical protein